MAYQTITHIIQQFDSDLSASEAHGLATGMLCIDNNTEVASWFEQLFPEQVILLDEDKTVLASLFEQTRNLLKEEADFFSYDLFLPGEDDPLDEQMLALRLWCEGFLFGVGYTRSTIDWPDNSDEIMKDIVEFTKLDTEFDFTLSEQERNEQEAALIEIQEYLRAAVIMINDLFSEQNTGPSN